jgi:acetylornithine/N-succinyldiaminopimelate aminotransferase
LLASHVLPVYKRSKLEFDRGEGVYLFSADGQKYLDFAAGIAVNCLGHSHPKLVKALQNQAAKLWHVSNLYHIAGLERLADRLCEHSFADKVFFCNSGAEAVECAIKMVRKYHDETGNPERFRIICFSGAFHGRTLATISASDREKVMKGFEPPVDGFDHVPFNDLEAVKKAIGPETGGIMVEPIQGEGGIRPANPEFLKGLRKLCDEHGLLLVFDEIQCGMGRTGKFFAHELYGITPDILSSAKGIGGGFPLGACLATDKAAVGMKPGTHGSTYGSNPLAMAVGNAVMDVIADKAFLKKVAEMGAYLEQGLQKIKGGFPSNLKPVIEEIRGRGLMLGIKLTPPVADFVEKLRDRKLLAVGASDNVVRLLPPLIVEKQHIDNALEIIHDVCKEFGQSA